MHLCLIFLFFSTSIIITIIVSVPCIGNLMIEMVLLIIVEIVTIIIIGVARWLALLSHSKKVLS